MEPLHIIGRKNHGKTTLLTELLQEFTTRGLRVGTIKHSPHSHTLDTPGKDSFRHREAGAVPAAIVTPDMTGVFIPRTDQKGAFDQLTTLFAGCDLVLIEGHVDGTGKKVEVWREEMNAPPLAFDRDDVAALITDDPVDSSVPVWPRKDTSRLADRILSLL
jgi:molybdopterin-guanine dinucleotide biosynthesis protein B